MKEKCTVSLCDACEHCAAVNPGRLPKTHTQRFGFQAMALPLASMLFLIACNFVWRFGLYN